MVSELFPERLPLLAGGNWTEIVQICLTGALFGNRLCLDYEINLNIQDLLYFGPPGPPLSPAWKFEMLYIRLRCCMVPGRCLLSTVKVSTVYRLPSTILCLFLFSYFSTFSLFPFSNFAFFPFFHFFTFSLSLSTAYCLPSTVYRLLSTDNWQNWNI